MSWRETVRQQLLESGLFGDVQVIGGKLRAVVFDSIFLDVYHDPSTGSYSYGLIDLSALSPKDKRVLGWDDCPHPDEPAMVALNSYPHHHHRKSHDALVTTDSTVRGVEASDIHQVIEVLRGFLERAGNS